MNFEGLRRAVKIFEEVLVIGKDIYVDGENREAGEEKDGKLWHIAGMTRQGNQARLYVLTENDPEKDRAPFSHGTNRAGLKAIRGPEFFMEVETIKIGEAELRTREITGYGLGALLNDNCEELLVFSELMKAGWKLPENSTFAWKSWEELWVILIDFDLEEDREESAVINIAEPGKAAKLQKRLPGWENQEVSVRLRKSAETYFIEKPVCLTVGKEEELFFSLKDGRTGVCYINRVYPMDVWRDNEERFQDPRYLEIMTKEELEERKEEFFEILRENCPKGKCFLGIEYECVPEGNLVFYDRNFLERTPEENKGSARVMMMLLKPDNPIGKHSLRRHGCAIQTPVSPDIRQMEAELFSYVETRGEKEVKLFEKS